MSGGKVSGGKMSGGKVSYIQLCTQMFTNNITLIAIENITMYCYITSGSHVST